MTSKWYWEGETEDGIDLYGDGDLILSCNSADYECYSEIPSKDYQRRIVALANAFAHLSTEAIEALVPNGPV